jgi:hypothetical protein
MTKFENKVLVAVSKHTNPLNETFIFGQFGKVPKNHIVITLQFVEPGSDGDKLLRFWERRVGKKYSEIEQINVGVAQTRECYCESSN